MTKPFEKRALEFGLEKTRVLCLSGSSENPSFPFLAFLTKYMAKSKFLFCSFGENFAKMVFLLKRQDFPEERMKDISFLDFFSDTAQFVERDYPITNSALRHKESVTKGPNAFSAEFLRSMAEDIERQSEGKVVVLSDLHFLVLLINETDFPEAEKLKIFVDFLEKIC